MLLRRSLSAAARLGATAAIAVCIGCPATPSASVPEPATVTMTAPTADATTAAPTADVTTTASPPWTPPKPTARQAWNITFEGGATPWMKSTPTDGDTLLTLSGPPGGPLSVSVERGPDLPGDAELVAWIKAFIKKNMNQEIDGGTHAKVALGGAQARAYAFFTGTSMARTEWCCALWPQTGSGKGSVIVSAGVSAGNKQAASCASVTSSPPIAPVWSSLKVVPR